VLSIVVSTIAFFVSSFFIRRWADQNDLPKGMTRSVSIFTLALALAYVAGWAVSKLA